MPNPGNSTQPSSSVSEATSRPPGQIRVALLYKRGCQPDETLLNQLEKKLTENGLSVFIDRQIHLGVDWAREIEKQIRTADAVVPLLSERSIQSEMMAFEIENAHEAAQAQHGRPRLLPIRIQFTGSLPEPMAGILDPIQYQIYQGPEDDDKIVTELLRALKELPTTPPTPLVVKKGLRLMPRTAAEPRAVPVRISSPAPSIPAAFEPIGGAVPLNSEYYIDRSADAEFRAALARHDSIVLIKGARQIGKTSLLARGLQFSRERGTKAALTDFQKFNASNLENVGNFYLSLAESLADQLEISVVPSDVWDERRGANVNFERFLRREVLARMNAPLIWGLDEVDRLFACPFGSEVFGLFRSWHNERALDPSGPWAGLTLAIAYATEAHLFITDMNQSPFNVGTRLTLEEFNENQVAELNRRYRSPLKSPDELKRFIRLLDGHPFLVRRGLHEMADKKISLDAFEKEAPRDEGIFGDHLRRILVLLAKDPRLTEVVKGILKGQPCPNPESFYRLRSAGVMSGSSQAEVRPRCQLYAIYLGRHLL